MAPRRVSSSVSLGIIISHLFPPHSEIDVFEGVNLGTNNQMGLHTLPGCTTPGGNQVKTSQTASTDCSYLANSNEGCKVVDTNTNSYGAAFGNAGGGVFVTEFATSGISWVIHASVGK
jgi:hypothetical protein